LAAKHLLEPSGRRATFALKSFLEGDDWWREVIIFYLALATDPKEIETFIKKTTQSLLARSGNQFARSRAGHLLEILMGSFPGAQANFNV
jgi:hypothetical protein